MLVVFNKYWWEYLAGLLEVKRMFKFILLADM